MAADDLLLVSRDDGVATVTLNRPGHMNALSAPLRSLIAATFDGFREDPELRAVILTGAGRAFCAGLDLKELGGETSDDARPGGTLDEANMIKTLWRCPVPIVGAVNGYAITGGFELALACDFLIASREARFADTHARVGIVPGWGLSQLLPRRVGAARAKELSFTGNFLDAEAALRCGLVNRVVAPEALLDTCVGIAKDIASCEPGTLREIKRVYDDGARMDLGDALAFEAEASRAWSRGVSAADVAERRRAIQARGREQTR